MMLKKLFKYFRKEARIKRASDAGFVAAKKVVNSFCSDEELKGYWAEACICEAFGSEFSKAYDRSFKEALRPLMRSRGLVQ